MKNTEKILVLLLVVLFFCIGTVGADERTENIDVFIVLDKSLSMIEEIESVKEYIRDSLLDKILIPGDRFVIIAFYGKTELLMNEVYDATGNMNSIRNKIENIQADGRFTDIGNALDTLHTVVQEIAGEERRRFLLLLTDGKQEASPESKYYTPDGQFNHEMLKNTKTIQKQGWKIHILGIGTQSAAEELAKELSAGYINVPDVPEDAEDKEAEGKKLKQALEEVTEDLVGSIELISSPKVEPIPPDGSTEMHLTLKSEGFSKAQKVLIKSITLEYDGKEYPLRKEDVTLSITPEGTEEKAISIQFPNHLDAGDYQGRVAFTFSGSTVFYPAYREIDFHVKGFFENNLFTLLAGGIILLIAVTVLIILLRGKKRRDEEEDKKEDMERNGA